MTFLKWALLVLVGSCSSGCMLLGEAVFYTDVRIVAADSEMDVREVVVMTAYNLSYSLCPDLGDSKTYCKKKIAGQFRELTTDMRQSVLEFESFGVPDRQRDAVDAFVSELKRVCSQCAISARARSHWGVSDEVADWKAI
ncbi:MAG: hypothetical protein II007_00555 [Gammaproteobacteria bacterium]|nr:hypothetical protein [Gammaproteobacteria bacterium]